MHHKTDKHTMTELTRNSKKITACSIGTLDIDFAANLFAPLFLKIHERNQSNGLLSAA